MAATELKPPIFLIGNYRSGTTIAQKLIGLHPDIATWYEPKTIWLYADPARRHDEFGENDATEKVARYIRGRFLEYQSLQAGIATLCDGLIDLRLGGLRQFADIDNVDALDRRRRRLSAGRRRLRLRRGLLLGAGNGRGGQRGGGCKNDDFAHGFSFHRMGQGFGKRSVRGCTSTSTAKWDQKVSPSGSLHDHWMAM